MNSRWVRVGIIGGLENGQALCDYLSSNRFVHIEFIVTYPETEKAIKSDENCPVLHTHNAMECLELKYDSPLDYIFVAGWSGLLNDDVLAFASEGVVGFHPSKLPKDRGRSVLAWQIEEGYSETALTMFYYTNVPDGGDIIAQELIAIDCSDNVGDLLKKVTRSTKNLITAHFPLMRNSIAQRISQCHSESTVRRLRTDDDSEIIWNAGTQTIYNKVRAVTRPYPGALSSYHKTRVVIWEVEVLDITFKQYAPLSSQIGDVVAEFSDGTYVVKARDGFIKVIDYEKQ